jgi:GH35 family endo-1,4-beta-xylanase
MGSEGTVDNILRHLNVFDEQTADRIASDTERYRKGWMSVRVVDSHGNPIPDARVRVKQRRHDFLFGINSFWLKDFDSDELNDRYERGITDVFNHAVVPFYWGDLEPEQGKPRYDADSPWIYRRPPPDLVVDWCEDNHITPKGHPLLWHMIMPQWLPADETALKRLIRKRLETIADRYGDRVHIWDVVNEALARSSNPAVQARADRIDGILFQDYIAWMFRRVADLFPAESHLIYNDVTPASWKDFHYENTPLYLLAENLILKGASIDGLGLQYHIWKTAEDLQADADVFFNPRHLLAAMDQYAGLGLRQHVSEISLPCPPDLSRDEAELLQSRLAESLYRVWFSHPSCDSIVYWNLIDGKAHGNEGHWKVGLLREGNLEPKPAYVALRRLIQEEWTTDESRTTDVDGSLQVKAFYGEYELHVEVDGATEQYRVHLVKDKPSRFEVESKSRTSR